LLSQTLQYFPPHADEETELHRLSGGRVPNNQSREGESNEGSPLSRSGYMQMFAKEPSEQVKRLSRNKGVVYIEKCRDHAMVTK
jgi:hypothetical protein